MKEEQFIEMLNGCHRKEHKSQTLLYDSYHRFVYRTIAIYIEEKFSVEDVLSITFEKVFENINTLKERYEPSLRAWIRRIAINQSIMYQRENKKLKLNERITDAHISVLSSNEHEYSCLSDLEFLYNKIKELPEQQRTVFNLRAIDGYSAKEVSEKLNMHITACKSNYSRAKKKMQEKIKLNKII